MYKNNNSEQNLSLLSVAKQFDVQGIPFQVNSFGSGHINDTYKFHTDQKKGYLLQRINHHVFKNVEDLMNNISLVTTHLHKKRIEAQVDDVNTVLTPLKTHDGNLYVKDKVGDYWRVYHLIEDAKSYDIVENSAQAAEAGRAFGKFQRLLADLDATKIKEVIPDFCHIGSRLADFYEAIEANGANRKSLVEEEIEFIVAREKRMKTILDMVDRDELPLRITHNDTKFNNVLLDKQDRAKCVIDLDTVMPGYVAYDYGDAIRTIINRAAEDEVDLDNVKLNIPLFKAYTMGYFEEAKSFLTVNEVESLLAGAFLFPYMQAVRFLTDYLQGDTYYKVRHPEHNLQRTRAQLKLVKEMELHGEELEAIIVEIAQHYSLRTTP